MGVRPRDRARLLWRPRPILLDDDAARPVARRERGRGVARNSAARRSPHYHTARRSASSPHACCHCAYCPTSTRSSPRRPSALPAYSTRSAMSSGGLSTARTVCQRARSPRRSPARAQTYGASRRWEVPRPSSDRLAPPFSPIWACRAFTMSSGRPQPRQRKPHPPRWTAQRQSQTSTAPSSRSLPRRCPSRLPSRSAARPS